MGFLTYCSLNIGCSGVLDDPESLDFIDKNFEIGDILNLEIRS